MSHKQKQISRELARLRLQRFREKRTKCTDETETELGSNPSLTEKLSSIAAVSQEEGSKDADLKTLILKYHTEHITEIKNLESQLKTQNEQIAEMKSMMMELKNSGSYQSDSSNKMAPNNGLLKEHSISERINNLEKFEDFDLKLKSDQCFRDKIEKIMWPLVDANKITKSIINILMKFMSRELVLQFTAIKQTGDKKLFKNTALCSCIHDAINTEFQIQNMPAIKEKVFYKSLGQAISNAVDWDGYRKQRIKTMK